MIPALASRPPRDKRTIPTSDNLQEVFDIVDRHDRVIGRATRQQCHADPSLIHRSVMILIFNDKDEILWQKRSQGKDLYPGQWGPSASGHVDAGEEYDRAAARELKEELGVELEMEYLGTFLFSYHREQEFSALYRAYSQGPFQPDVIEVEDIRFLSLSTLLELEAQQELELVPAVHHIIAALQPVSSWIGPTNFHETRNK